MFQDFFGNPAAVNALETMIRRERIPQTLLVDGPRGVGKATLARRFAAALVGDAVRIERDDLSLPDNLATFVERDKWTSDKRAEDPLFFGSHPDFLTFPPEGPLRQISIQQMRLVKERARFKPLAGRWRVFLIDRLDRANEQAANSLLKTLEEPPAHLILVATAENPYDLLPTVRSRAVPIHLAPLSRADLLAFAQARGLPDSERRITLAAGSPGLAASLDLGTYDRRRDAMLTLLEVASGQAPFAAWASLSESIGARKTEKLDSYLDVLHLLLEDLLLVEQRPRELRNLDLAERLRDLARRVSFDWIRIAVRKTDELVDLLRRNIQKGIALDALVLELRALAPAG
ncbi:MAG: ATP-binding protein [Pseudomonadota bacterium]